MKKLTPVEEVNLQAIERIERSLVRSIIEKRDHQAYTSLVEGIEGMKGVTRDWDTTVKNNTLIDILENVVKPLYRKE